MQEAGETRGLFILFEGFFLGVPIPFLEVFLGVPTLLSRLFFRGVLLKRSSYEEFLSRLFEGVPILFFF